MKTVSTLLLAACMAVFLCLPSAFAQDDIESDAITPYPRHDAKTGLQLDIPLDTECLLEADQRFAPGEPLIYPWNKERADWEAAQTLAVGHCNARLNRLLIQKVQGLEDRLDELIAALAGEPPE